MEGEAKAGWPGWGWRWRVEGNLGRVLLSRGSRPGWGWGGWKFKASFVV